jgi:hypothetical protein
MRPIVSLKDEDIIAITLQPNNNEEAQQSLIQSSIEPKSRLYKASILTANGTFSAMVASITAFLNFLGDLGITLDKIHSTEDLQSLINQRSVGEIANATWFALCSEVLNTAISIVYIGPAIKKVKNILLKGFNTFRRKCGTNTIHGDTLDVIDVISCIWAFGACLPFAQIAKDTFNFIGGFSYIPFSLNGLFYFSTRCSGIEAFFRGLFDKNLRLIKTLINDLLSIRNIKTLNIPVNMNDSDVNGRLNNALIQYLTEFYNEKISNFTNSKYFRLGCINSRLQWIITTIGLPFTVALLAISMWPLTAQKSIQGFESLTTTNIGASANYQNALTLGLGYPIALPALFFYARAIYNIPREISKYFKEVNKRYQTGSYFIPICLIALFLLLFYMAIVSRKGMQDVAQTLIQQGYLNYLNITSQNLLGEIFPNTVATAVASVNASVTLTLLNRWLSSKDVSEITEIDHKTALWLLEYSSIDAEIVKKHEYFSSNKENCCTFFKKTSFKIRKRRNKEENKDSIELLDRKYSPV